MLPESYDASESEARWQSYWEKNRTYETPPNADTAYSIDTPPPTVSGDLHMGHIYQFTIQDFAARFRRMYEDSAVFFPFGFDNNGIASERLAEREENVERTELDRQAFKELTRTVCEQYQDRIEQDVRQLATSVDWSKEYQTIDDDVIATSQLSFIQLYENDRQYRDRGPAIWCPDCSTAISQTELEDETVEGAFHDIQFDVAGSDRTFTVSTTRPELLPACSAVFVHPDDAASELAGRNAIVPLFDRTVPIISDDRVDPDTGSGIVMCCTFGDQLDVDWYRSYDLDLHLAIDEDGEMTELASPYDGLTTKAARDAIVDDLDEAGVLEDRRDITHTVRVHERCGVENEYRVATQWYIRILDKKQEYLDAGKQLDWTPEKMHTRYKNWVEGLEWDWCISRQRDAGVPMPCWYCQSCSEVITPSKDALPVDPREDACPRSSCPSCGATSFEPETDVLDTWATSSLTPLINAGWHWDTEAEETTFEYPERYPMTLRPQGHDIISFWLFNTIVKTLEHTGELPFQNVMINGHVLDENRRKMSASKGNVVAPADAFDEYSTDAIRYWAAGAAVGDDFPYDTKDLVSGEKLVTKLWNASRVVEQEADEVAEEPATLNDADAWLLDQLASVTENVTDHFKTLSYSKARQELRTFFWHTFCDNYLELAKQRMTTQSLSYTLRIAHRTLLKLFAPIVPHVTEELWHELYSQTSIHTTDWPALEHRPIDASAGDNALHAVDALRRWKTNNGYSLNKEIPSVTVYGDIEPLDTMVQELMHVENLHLKASDDRPETMVVAVELNHELAGPEYGAGVKDIEVALEQRNYDLQNNSLHAAGYVLDEEMFEVEYGFEYDGSGTVLQEEEVVVIVEDS